MRYLIRYILLILFCLSQALGQSKSNKWVIQGGIADWAFYLQDFQTMEMRNSLSMSRVLGNRFLIGGKLISDFSASWPTDTRPNGWSFNWNPSWIGLTSKAYLNKVPRVEKILNPYVELGLGCVFWSGIRRNVALQTFERVNYFGPDWSVGAGASLWMIPELSMDFQATYLPYFSKTENQAREIRPHQLFFALSFSYWFGRQKKSKSK